VYSSSNAGPNNLSKKNEIFKYKLNLIGLTNKAIYGKLLRGQIFRANLLKSGSNKYALKV